MTLAVRADAQPGPALPNRPTPPRRTLLELVNEPKAFERRSQGAARRPPPAATAPPEQRVIQMPPPLLRTATGN
jgi:hypothetical protein